MNEFECVIPILSVMNFGVSLDYYVNKLGFTKKWTADDPPTFGCVARGKVEIFLSEGGQGQPGTWMSIFMEDVDALHEEYKKEWRDHSPASNKYALEYAGNECRGSRRPPPPDEWRYDRPG
jgi:Glyoxalase superfamily protein